MTFLGKTISALSIAFVLSAAVTQADAATVTLSLTSSSPSKTEKVSFNGGSTEVTTATGTFNWNVGTNGVPAIIESPTLSTFCIQGTQSVSIGGSYNYSVLGPGQGSYNSVFTNSSLVSAFFNQYYDGVLAATGTTTRANYYSAFQLCLWELVYDGIANKPITGDKNNSRWFVKGNFEIDHSSSVGYSWGKVDFTAAEINLAETWLDSFNANTTGNWVVYQLAHSSKQDQVFAVQRPSGATPTPLPAAMPGGLALLAGLAVYRRYRRKA